MAFCTAVNCMDGRVQLPVIQYLMERFGTRYVDSITEPGPVAILGEEQADPRAESIMERIRISIEKHNSRGIAIVAHHNCAGNPVSKDTQMRQMKKSVSLTKDAFPGIEVIGLWVDEDWKVIEV